MSVLLTSAYAKLPAQDVERARAFYRDVVGLEPVHENHGHLFYECGGSSFLVFPSSGLPSGAHDQLGFGVEDIEATAAELRRRGIELETYEAPPGCSFSDGIMDYGPVKAAWFKDSEGNLISIAQFVSG
ncbi:MAG TPA: VOC family protein [Gaiellaceae bacterium]|jgi:catechol 2,3-dioxygenase-like lactoylglutathione lyase family enzyme|nr:VOC family protein [Gaiellaceae bacterium]